MLGAEQGKQEGSHSSGNPGFGRELQLLTLDSGGRSACLLFVFI